MARFSIYMRLLALLVSITLKAAAEEPTGTALRGGAGRALAPVTETFPTPRYNGVRVDWCSGYDQRVGPNDPAGFLGCGQGSADIFCRTVGYDSASAFDKDEQISEPTIYLLQTANNANPLHDSFKSVTCIKGDGQQPPVRHPTGPNGR